MVLVRRSRLASLVIAFALLPVMGTQAQAQDGGIEVGAKAPGAAVESLDGQAVDLSSVLGKEPVVIQFWATWCPTCKSLEPKMTAAQAKYAGKVRFVGVAVSVNQSPRAVQAYAAKHAAKMTHFFDRRGKAVDAYEVPATGFVVVVNKAGTVVYTGLGSDQDLDAAIKKAM
ncbi:MAG: TlpA family protein disulfide reductase [Gemmatimonadetes bacterium]|nr:TlpA family protein disulfide reductase [Gemmatimonadota bacterium]